MSALGGGPNVDETPPVALGKPCLEQWECGYRAACNPVTATCDWPCDTWQHTTKSVACPSSHSCVMVQAKMPWVCVPSCAQQSCPSGFFCNIDKLCYRLGDAKLGMPCVDGDFFTGCESALTCDRGTCVSTCNPRAEVTGCSGEDQCATTFCTAEGDAAAVGQRCANAMTSARCGGDGRVWRGRCSNGTCIQDCNSDADCPCDQTCRDWICATP